jgi:uncharacterized integral membrane protein (TIGR00698 family)
MPSSDLPMVRAHEAPGPACAPPASPPPEPRFAALRRVAPGLALCALLAVAARAAAGAPVLQRHGFSALTLAIVFGLLIAHSAPARLATRCAPGVQWAKQVLLRLGIVLFGLHLTLQDVARVGVAGVTIDALTLGSTFALACLLGMRVLGLDRRTAMLVGAGSSICGAAAVLATEPVLRARADEVTVAVGTVVLFGTLAIFVYPLLYRVNLHWALIPGGASGFGVYAGSTVHEVAQVLAAARSVSAQAADTAVITKMIRVMMLAPFLLLLSAWLARRGHACDEGGRQGRGAIVVPWFALGFIVMVGVNSLHLLPTRVSAPLDAADTLLLATAMAALGASSHWQAVRRAGIKPVLLALALFAWLVVGGAAINHLVPALLA